MCAFAGDTCVNGDFFAGLPWAAAPTVNTDFIAGLNFYPPRYAFCTSGLAESSLPVPDITMRPVSST